MAPLAVPTLVIAALALACAPGSTGDPPEARVIASVDEFAAGLDFADRDALPGKPLYETHCAHCHDGSVAKAPHVVWLEMMPPRTLLAALEQGVMAAQAAGLSAEERVHVVEYLTRRRLPPPDDGALASLRCSTDGFDASRPPPRAGWGHDTRRFVPAEAAGLAAEDLAELELRWAFAFPGAMRARSQPAIGWGAVYVGSQSGRVYAFDLESGCVRWTYEASAEVRTGIVLAEVDGRPVAFFGDVLARVHAVDARTGEPIWSRKLDDHPSATLTATPAWHAGTLYAAVSSLEVTAAADPGYACCSFRGSVHALDGATGERRWLHWAIPELPRERGRTAVGTRRLAPSGAPIWASPTVDVRRGRLYVGTGENYSSPADGNSDAVLAIDLATGARVWTRQITAGDAWNTACMMADNPNCPEEDGPDHDLGSSLLLIDVGGGRDLLVAGHKDGSAFALDPDAQAPEIVWRTRLGRGSIQGGVHFGLAAEGTTVYVPINDMNDTRDGRPLDPAEPRPGVHAVDARTGRVLWSRVAPDRCGDSRPLCDPGVSSPVTAIPGAVLAGHLDGVLRAHARRDGEVLWSVDTTRIRATQGAVPGQGGSMSGAGPWAGEGFVVLNSGYGLYFHEPGNLFLAFGPPRAAPARRRK